MSEQSDRLREQAFQAERLSQTISDHRASQTLKSIAAQYHAQADELERGLGSASYPLVSQQPDEHPE
ncbi:hypothetical protein ACNJX9_31905 [Bradyrhizobium sp. DASA03076]|uniref:Uncharacterized protein n=1 Tax=Bradyrhizobium manausense TaxID=989370 RepID=A0A0R3DSB6_9BRAD|nr:hypothetical protein [Bradyrhizobium manausense]KRQ12650.1 hypothetical protein AOQ71_16015 [Bradyrhizobium manausense]